MSTITRPQGSRPGTIYVLVAPDTSGAPGSETLTQRVGLVAQSESDALKESLQWMTDNLTLTRQGLVATLHVIYVNDARFDEVKRVGRIGMGLT